MKHYILIKHFFLFMLFAVICSCASYRNTVTVISGANYDKKNDSTTFFRFPYGSVSFSGEWTKANYVETSKQQFFSNSDSVKFSVALNPIVKYEFNADGSKTGFDFVQSYYQWDTDFLISQIEGLKSEILVSDNVNNILIYRLFNEKGINNYFLISEKNGISMILTESDSDKWSHEQRISFLKDVYKTYK